jgi:2-amino-4-hydroxy-6-hydroxymethyldihydropteridine diphosphokinase
VRSKVERIRGGVPTLYAIALGSNQPHVRFGAPRDVLSAALRALDEAPLKLLAASPVVASRPIGPSIRSYANGAAIIETDLDPRDLLDHLKLVERRFGRKAGGQRWRARVLDLDILLWLSGAYVDDLLCIPHREMRIRPFVLGPLASIAPDWRDPVTGLSVRHLKARLDRKAPAA